MVQEDYTMMYRPMPEEFKALFPVITMEIAGNFGLHYTTKHQGKMTGMDSLSTTCKCNDECKAKIWAAFRAAGVEETEDPRKALKEYIHKNPLATNILICGLCFSDRQQDYQASMTIPLERNYVILNNGIIHSDWIPVINSLYFRGESFGDFASVNAVANFYNMARKNGGVHFTAWTKNTIYFKKAAAAGLVKPDNFRLVLSSPFINKQAAIPAGMEKIIDAIFTVYTKEYAEKFGITINCGARACLSCLRCYKNFDGVKIVNEELK